ncbi:MAG: Panacea domain-containing protein [Longimicrobiales bacterium]|nr:Panacea domain-containing protein [Longimicrobiales bacterium]
MKLLKLMYFADRKALQRWGRPITFDAFVSMRNGPVLSRTYGLISGDSDRRDGSLWSEFISAPEGYDVALVGDCPTDQLSDAEVELLREVFKEFGHQNRWDLVDYAHTLPEWTDPGDSALPIEYANILTAGGWSEAEVAQIVSELEELALADRLF